MKRNQKTIFRGTVNGAQFDNVDDYNKAIKYALNMGTCNASSETRTVDEEVKNYVPILPAAEVNTNGEVTDVCCEGVSELAHRDGADKLAEFRDRAYEYIGNTTDRDLDAYQTNIGTMLDRLEKLRGDVENALGTIDAITDWYEELYDAIADGFDKDEIDEDVCCDCDCDCDEDEDDDEEIEINPFQAAVLNWFDWLNNITNKK